MAILLSAYGYQGDATNLPVADAEAAVRFYIDKMGFSVADRIAGPGRKIVLERDGVQFAISENGGDPEQDGCAFHTDDAAGLRTEFIDRGMDQIGELKAETRGDGSRYEVFFVIAPDGLCFWFGQAAG
jgi:catechol 2,3-dioxygenase-like lactoylglutathione lyase family enzyme